MQPSLGSGRASRTGLRVLKLVMTTKRLETASTWFDTSTPGAGPPDRASGPGLGLGVHLRSTCFVTRTPKIELGPGLWSKSWSCSCY